MKLKSLLLGSAAVLVAVTGAQNRAMAADAIVVEPEPVEYVRICDAYGEGWFYIPGTETCIKFDGDVRVQYGFREYHDGLGSAVYDDDGNFTGLYDDTSVHEWNYRARLNIRANNETEYGTLSSRIRFVGDSAEGGHNDFLSQSEGPGSAGVTVDTAYISLAGFSIGFDDSFWHRGGDYGYYEARFDGLYIFHNGIYADYTFASNGWAFTIGAEDGNNSGESGAPDAYAGASYSTDNWYLAGVVYNDSSQGEIAWKVRADYDFGNGYKVGGFYMSDDGNTDYVKGHLWGVTAKMNLTDNMILFGGYSDWAEFAADGNNASASNYTVGIAWDIVPGLRIQPEYTATWFEAEDLTNDDQRNHGRFSLRVERSF